MADPYKYQISGSKRLVHLYNSTGVRYKVVTVRRLWIWPVVTVTEGNSLIDTLLDESEDTDGLTWEDIEMSRNKGGPSRNVTATQILVTKTVDPL